MSLIPAKAYDLYYELGRRGVILRVDGNHLVTSARPAEIGDLTREILRLETWIVEIVKSRQKTAPKSDAEAKSAAPPLAPDATPLNARATKALASLNKRLGYYAPKLIEHATKSLETAAKANESTIKLWSCLSPEEKRDMAICRAWRECEEWRAPVEAPKPLPREIRKPAKLYARPYPMPNGGG